MPKMTMVPMVVTALLLPVAGFAAITASDILNDLHKTNQKEVHMGQLAQQKGATDPMRNYGQMLATDHQDADQKVMELAKKESVTIKPAEKGMMDKMEMKNLQSKSGPQFDRDFAKMMVADHRKDIAKLKDAQKDTGLSQDVKDLIGQLLPKLQKHLDTAQSLTEQKQTS
jgi:putative membrane protein